MSRHPPYNPEQLSGDQLEYFENNEYDSLVKELEQGNRSEVIDNLDAKENDECFNENVIKPTTADMILEFEPSKSSELNDLKKNEKRKKFNEVNVESEDDSKDINDNTETNILKILRGNTKRLSVASAVSSHVSQGIRSTARRSIIAMPQLPSQMIRSNSSAKKNPMPSRSNSRVNLGISLAEFKQKSHPQIQITYPIQSPNQSENNNQFDYELNNGYGSNQDSVDIEEDRRPLALESNQRVIRQKQMQIEHQEKKKIKNSTRQELQQKQQKHQYPHPNQPKLNHQQSNLNSSNFDLETNKQRLSQSGFSIASNMQKGYVVGNLFCKQFNLKRTILKTKKINSSYIKLKLTRS